MKYYSEIIEEFFDSEEELKHAEEVYDEKAVTVKKEPEKIRDAQNKITKDESDVSKQKKELANKIDEADDNLRKAEEAYDLAQEEAKSIMQKARKEVSEIINPAADAVREAQKSKLHAIQDFNNKFGKYSVIYTGDKAYAEWRRSRSLFDDFFNSLSSFRFF